MANENKNASSYKVYLFVFFSVLLLALSVWIVWDDEFGLRPWKKYQEEYKTLKHQQLEKDYRMAVSEFQRSGGAKHLAELESNLKKAEDVFHSKPVQEKYGKLKSQLDELHDKVVKNQKALQIARGQFLETEYFFTKNQKPQDKAKMDELQRQIDSIDKSGKVLRESEDSVKQSIAQLTAGMDAMRAEIESIKNMLEDKKEKIANNDKAAIEIKQYHIGDIDKADRCESCHAGIQGKKQVSSREPFTKHPLGFIYLDRHQSGKFGCTFCHRGQGRATTSVEKAHGREKHWPEPLLEGDNDPDLVPELSW